MKVAIVYPYFAHYRGPIMRALAEGGRHQYLFAFDPRLEEAGIQRWRMPDQYETVPTRCWYLSRRVLLQFGLIRLALRGDIDVFIYLGNAFWPLTWVSAAVARVRGKRVLFWTHGYTKPAQGLKNAVRTAFYRIANGLLLYGHFAKQIGLARGIASERMHVIYNSLDADVQRGIIARFQGESEVIATRLRLFGDSKPMVICTSRLMPAQQLDLLIKAVAVLRGRGVEVNVLLVGDGPERQSLQRLVNDLGVSCRFYGASYDEFELGPLIMAANVMVSPGKSGLTTMHALGYGIPIVTHNDPEFQMPEFEAVQPGITGTLFERGSVESLADGIQVWVQQVCVAPGVRAACREIIDKLYSPQSQRLVIERAVEGYPADDLWLPRLRIVERSAS